MRTHRDNPAKIKATTRGAASLIHSVVARELWKLAVAEMLGWKAGSMMECEKRVGGPERTVAPAFAALELSGWVS